MSAPSKVQFAELQAVCARLPLPADVFFEQTRAGAVVVHTGAAHEIRTAAELEDVLFEIRVIDPTLDPGEFFDEFVAALPPPRG